MTLKVVVAAAALMTTGCAAAMLNHPIATANSPDNLRDTRNGLCASKVIRETIVGFTMLKACAQIGAPGTLADDGKTAILSTTLIDDTFELANPGNWQIEVFDANTGDLLLKKMLKRSVPSVGTCTNYGCNKWGFDVSQFPPGWSDGSYLVRYTCAFDTGYVAELKLNIGNSTAPVAKRAPAPETPPATSPAQPAAVETATPTEESSQPITQPASAVTDL